MSDKIDLTVVVDRSGSMSSIKKEAENGLNEFFAKQREAAPKTRLTLAQFDNEYEVIHENVPIKKVKAYALKPRGLTALLDAVGRTALKAATRIKKGMTSIFVVLTDGRENASQEFEKAKVREAIEALKKKGCEIVFLGANIDSFAEAGSYGIPAGTTTNYAATPAATRSALRHLSANAVSYSIGTRANMDWMESQRGDMSGSAATITPDALQKFRQSKGLSWSALERAAGLGNATLSKYAKGQTSQISDTTQHRLRAAFPELS